MRWALCRPLTPQGPVYLNSQPTGTGLTERRKWSVHARLHTFHSPPVQRKPSCGPKGDCLPAVVGPWSPHGPQRTQGGRRGWGLPQAAAQRFPDTTGTSLHLGQPVHGRNQPPLIPGARPCSPPHYLHTLAPNTLNTTGHEAQAWALEPGAGPNPV